MTKQNLLKVCVCITCHFVNVKEADGDFILHWLHMKCTSMCLWCYEMYWCGMLPDTALTEVEEKELNYVQ